MERNQVKTRYGEAENVRFDSFNEAVAMIDASRSATAISIRNEQERDNFYGRGWNDTRSVMQNGDNAAVQRITNILDKVDASFRDREAVQWLPSVAGAYPVVPDFLAGNPECMRYRQPVEDDRSPIRIFVGITVSAGVNIKTAEKRGAAAAALAMRLAEDRPVELWAYCDMRIKGQTKFIQFRVSTTPISAHEISFALGSIEALRRVGFAAHRELVGDEDGGSINWAFGKYNVATDEYLQAVREGLNAAAQDVVLPGGFVTEVEQMADNPVKWVHDKLESQRQLDAG